MAQNFADTEASTKVAALVEIGIQASANRDFGKLEACLKDTLEVLRGLHCKRATSFSQQTPNLLMDENTFMRINEEELDIYEEYERMTQLPGTRLPELIRNCMNQEDSPQIFFLAAEINLKLEDWRTIGDDGLCVRLIPEKLFRLMSTSRDLAVIKEAYAMARKAIFNAILHRHRGIDLISTNPLLGPGFVDVLLHLGMQYPEHEEFISKTRRVGIPCFLEDNVCCTHYVGRRRATAIIRKVLNAVSDIIANESSSPALLIFGLMCFSSVSVTSKRGELRIMINAWIQYALARLTNFLEHPDHGVQTAAMEAFEDIVQASPEIAKHVVDCGIFVKVAASLNPEELDMVGENALGLLWAYIVKNPEDWVIEGIVQAQIPDKLTQRLLLRVADTQKMSNGFSSYTAVAVQCLKKICEFIPLTVAMNLLESGTVMEWLNYIKEDPDHFLRLNLLKAILKHLAPKLKNGHPPSFQALTQMISETVGLDVSKRIEAVETTQDMGTLPDYNDEWTRSTFYDYSNDNESDFEDDREIDEGNDSD